jgi:hypothetical protein
VTWKPGQSTEGKEDVNVTVDDLPALQEVLNFPGNEDVSALIACETAAIQVGLTYPVENANQLSKFLKALGYTVPWFEQRFTSYLPVTDVNDFIAKVKLAIKQLHVLEPHGAKIHLNENP